ncbi:MMPL family transporter [Micromonospora sp. BRA006-A]|nr:MMPL family transporter [Micromonospora sp. BRA006-A]
MDYHVFVVSRIREAVDRGMPTREAVAYGITSSAGVVTSAAVVMVAVFSIFATLSMIDFKQLGIIWRRRSCWTPRSSGRSYCPR